MRSLTKIILFLLLIMIQPAYSVEHAQIKKGDILSLQDCVEIAVKNSPVIKKYEYNLEIAQSNVGIAKSAYFPTIGSGVGIYQDYNTEKEHNGSSNRELPSAAVTFNQLIWNFGKASSLIKMEQFYRLGAQYQFMDSICNTIYDVKIKYFNVLRTKAIVKIEQNNVLINEQNYKRTKDLCNSAKRSKIDQVNAELYLNEAKMRLVDAQNAYDNALDDLGNSLYIAYSPEFDIKNTDTFEFVDEYLPLNFTENKKIKDEKENSKKLIDVSLKTKIEKNTNVDFKKLPFSLEESFEIANKNSPDLWILESTQRAMEQSLLYIKRQYYPDLIGNLGYGYNNTRDFSNSSLNMSVNLSSALNIKQLRHEIDRAMAQVRLAGNEIDLFKQDLYFEVKKSYVNVEKNEKQIPSAKLKMSQALENFELADKSYEEGEVDYILLQNARNNYNDAKILYVNTLYNYNVSRANLEIAMHYHFDDLHHKVEHAMNFHYKDMIYKLEKYLECQHMQEEESQHHHEH